MPACLGVLTSAFRAAVVVFFAACAFALWGLPPSAWTPVQVISSAIGVGALVPQILLNYRQGSSGNWSGITAGASTAGNGLRVFTTIQLTGDPVLIVVRIHSTDSDEFRIVFEQLQSRRSRRSRGDLPSVGSNVDCSGFPLCRTGLRRRLPREPDIVLADHLLLFRKR